MGFGFRYADENSPPSAAFSDLRGDNAPIDSAFAPWHHVLLQEQPMPDEVILRRWSGKVPTERAQEYAKYMADKGFEEIETTEGNLGHQILLRDLGDGTTEITALSWWTGIDAIKALVGDDCTRAHYYAVDDIYLIEKPDFVEHHLVVSGFTPPER